jgi:hypothetical protein
MEELQPQDIEELLQELEEEYGPQQVPSPDVEQLLQDLQPERPFGTKKEAAEQLGRLSSSNLQIASALIVAKLSDPSWAVRKLAAELLLAPAHQEVLQQHPDLEKLASAQITPVTPSRSRRMELFQQYPDLIQSATSPDIAEEPSPDLQADSIDTKKAAAERPAILDMDYVRERSSAPHRYSDTLEPLNLILLQVFQKLSTRIAILRIAAERLGMLDENSSLRMTGRSSMKTADSFKRLPSAMSTARELETKGVLAEGVIEACWVGTDTEYLRPGYYVAYRFGDGFRVREDVGKGRYQSPFVVKPARIRYLARNSRICRLEYRFKRDGVFSVK